MRRLMHISPAAIQEGPDGFTVVGKADRENELVMFRMSPEDVAAVRAVPDAIVSSVYVEDSAILGVTALPDPDYDEDDE